jgi:hypothetical protein
MWRSELLQITDSGAAGLIVDRRQIAGSGCVAGWSPLILCAGGRAFCARTNEDFDVGDLDARYLCAVRRQDPLCADGSGPEALVKVERPQRSEDE